MAILYALISAFTASLSSIFTKIGLNNLNSNLVTAIRSIVIVFFSWLIVFFTGNINQISIITKKHMIFILLSGICTAISWLSFYKALQIGDASKVIPIDKFSLVISVVLSIIIFKETLNIKTFFGILFIVIGTFIMAL